MRRACFLTLVLASSPAVLDAHPFHENLEGLASPSPATILLITSPELEEAWEPFAEWKTSIGKPVRILTTEAIDERYEGPDLQEKMRRCIRNHVDHFATYWVILGGDSNPEGGVVPDRDTTHQVDGETVTNIPTDLYYLSNKDWDADNDGVYGEWEEDRDSIAYPDGRIGLGRIPVRTPEDVAAYTAKVIAYESRYPAQSFATSMVYTCPVPAAYPKLRASWDAHIAPVFTDGSVSRFFADITPWDERQPGDYALSPSNWLKLFNDRQTGKMHLHGHGLLDAWVLEHDEKVTIKDLVNLRNEDAYPVITTVSCFTGQFDSSEDPCISEALLRAPKAGAVAVVAPSREGRPHFHDPKRDLPLMVKEGKLDGTTRTMTHFWAIGLGRNVSLGEALMLTKASMEEEAFQSPAFHLCLSELNLLGDPSLPFRITNPRTPKIFAAKELEPGNISLLIETDAPGALVAVQSGTGMTYIQVADETGNALFPFSVRAGTTLTVTASGPDLNAASIKIPVR